MDVSITLWLYSIANTNAFMQWLSIFCAEYLAYILIIVFAGYLVLSSHTRREQIIAFGSALVAAGIARFGFAELIRFFYHRPRPFLTLHLNPLITETSYSFPSGHSTFFFAFSTVVYLYNKKLGTFFYIATIVMTTARIATGVHYPSDIIGGALIGILCGWLTFKYLLPLAKRLVEKVG